MYIIYQIVNKIDGKFYLGSAKNLTRRKARHLKLLRRGQHHSRYLQNAWNKYGEENFEFVVLQKVEPEKVYEFENQLIQSLKPAYNMMMCVFSHIGIKRSKETCKKISEALTGKSLSEEHKEKVRQANLGKKQSKTTVEKRMKNIYQPISAYHKDTGEFFREFESATHAAEELGISRMCIYEVINGRKKSYKNLVWKKEKQI